MMKTIRTFPTVNSISCVWIETGNPRRPLACVWMEDEITFLKPTRVAPVKSKVKEIRLCV